MEYNDLINYQHLDLDSKIELTKKYIIEYYEKNKHNVYVSFSGGIDSTVLIDIVREIYPDVRGLFCDTGLEYPEIRKFVKTFDNIDVIKPDINFIDVLQNYGYPIISKKVARQISDLKNPTKNNENIRNLYLTGYNSYGLPCKSYKISEKWKYLINADFKISARCCDKLKKEPLRIYEKTTQLNRIIGIMADEGGYRRESALKNDINSYGKTNISCPIIFWKRNDILQYITEKKLKYCKIYGDIIKNNDEYITTGEQRTGCMFCMFGVHLEKNPNRFERMKISHPKQYKFCMENLGCKKVLDFINVKY